MANGRPRCAQILPRGMSKIRIAIVEDGMLEELYLERSSQSNFVGNIYKGRIVNLEPSIQAAFVDFGVGRNGFLHISDVEPQYFRQGGYDPRQAIEPNGGQSRDRDFDVSDAGDDEPRGENRGDSRSDARGENRGRSGGRNGGVKPYTRTDRPHENCG